jgi:hypothetical protein
MKSRKALLWLPALLLSTNVAFADAIDDHVAMLDRLAISGSIRASHWSSSMDFDQRKGLAAGALWLKAAPRLGDNASLQFEGWTAGDRDQTDTRRYNRVREGYFNLTVGDTDFRFGKQIITWGRADKLNPTDNLTPRDYTLFVADDADQRSGSYAAQATVNVGGYALSGIWLPQFRPNILPTPSLPGVTFRESIEQRQGGAVKLERTGDAVDWSLSYYSGLDLNPDIAIDAIGMNGVNLRLDHHRVQVVGADAATVVGRYALRAEAAYTRTPDRDGQDPLLRNSMFHLVAGGDRTFFEYLNINLQYYARIVQHFVDPASINDSALRSIAIQESLLTNQYASFQQGLTFRVSDKWLDETLEGEVSGMAAFARRDYVLKPKLVYAFDDSWKGSLGAVLYRGVADSYYGRLKDLSTIYIELKYSF